MWCPDCQTDKSPEEFPRNRSNRSGRQTYCKPCYNARIKMYTERQHGSRRNFLLKLRYGITEQNFNQMLERQGGLCAICSGLPPTHVDHCHESNQVRGLLCFNCNAGLGRFEDDPLTIMNALGYLAGVAPEQGREP